MREAKCPGSMGFAEPCPEDVACSACGAAVEIWSDEGVARCDVCGCLVIRTDAQSCLDWCRYAAECLGEEGYRDYVLMKATIRKEALRQAAIAALPAGGDGFPSGISLALRFAEQLLPGEDGGDPGIVLAAVCLLPVFAEDGVCLADGCGRVSGPDAVAHILEGLHDTADSVARVLAVCQWVCGPSARLVEAGCSSVEHCIVHDALLLSQQEAKGNEAWVLRADRRCLTSAGQELALALRRVSRPDV